MPDLLKLPTRNNGGDVYVVVETPRGSAAKLEYDPELRVFTLSKALFLGLTYPYDWGFRTVIQSTCSSCTTRRPRRAWC